jgi:hypothetical protein
MVRPERELLSGVVELNPQSPHIRSPVPVRQQPPLLQPPGRRLPHTPTAAATAMMLDAEIFGLPIPDAGPAFATALVIHILSGLTAVIAGALAATARKRPGRHPRAGRVYLWALGGIFATVMAIIRWREDAHLFAIAVIAFSLGLYRYRPADAGALAGHPITPSAWAAPISPCSPASTSTTDPSCPSGTSYPTSPTGCYLAVSASRSYG